MPVYARKVTSQHPVFHNRTSLLITQETIHEMPVPDHMTLCNGCNENIIEGYLVYLGKRELKANQPYDYYCQSCLDSYFKGRIMVD